MHEEGQESWLAKLCGLPFVGDWVATFVGLAPLLIVFVLFNSWQIGHNWSFIVGAVVLVPWLLLLEGRMGLRINIPVLPIKWLWVAPMLAVLGVVGLFG